MSSQRTTGFIVDSFHRDPGDNSPADRNTHLYLVGRLENGQTFAVVEERQRPGFWIRASDQRRAEQLAASYGGVWTSSEASTIDGERCHQISFASVRRQRKAAEILLAEDVRTYEADLRFEDQFLIARHVHGSVEIEGESRTGNHVDQVFVNPALHPSDWTPKLSVLAFDIETATLEQGPPRGRTAGSFIPSDTTTITTISFCFADPWRRERLEEVFFLGADLNLPGIHCFRDESALLAAFLDRVAELDPDIITGWNVLDFDLLILAERCAALSRPFIRDRTGKPGRFVHRSGNRGNNIFISGRQVVDAVRLVRAAPTRYDDYSLETVARSVLGVGKSLEFSSDEQKMAQLARLRQDDPETLCRYCLQDARLVLDILKETGLLALTLSRCTLIGIDLARAWTSVASFEILYIEAMHVQNTVAPTFGVDSAPVGRAPGGAILEPQPGVFDNVFVFDFKSLYPSIIRTFNIDPLSYIPAGQTRTRPHDRLPGAVCAPNGACFDRKPAILPQLLDRFFQSRERAKAERDEIASFVYKIIMNSFYGVLGSAGCRFASSDLAGAITSFGQHILRWSDHQLQELGYQVIYGDTDSVFVVSRLPPETSSKVIHDLGNELCATLNKTLSEFIVREYELEPRLELELEKVYARFFLPPTRPSSRGPSDQSRARGRAKGYAGAVLAESAAPIEVIGMEAVRRDWTDLAKQFQVHLLELLFSRKPRAIYREYIRSVLASLRLGALDDRLVYQKALRKPIASYTRSRPPHVQAAELLEPRRQQGVIRYLWTKSGPQPIGSTSSDIDYEHYVEKQLKPIFAAIAYVLELSVEESFEADQQLELF